jgi:hypothetical protein
MDAKDHATEANATPRRGSRVRAYLRLFAFLVCVLGGSLLWTAQYASAELSERALIAGRQLERLAEHGASAGTTLRINGQVLTLTSATTELPIETVLDRFERLCARDSGGSAEELAALAAAPAGLPEGFDVRRFGVLRTESAHEGTAACFAREGKGGLAQLFGAVSALAESGDLQAFGQLRYLFVRRSERSGGNHVLTVSSEGALPLLQMWPETGDAPGRDLVDGVRPPEATRTLSAEAAGYALTTYESARPGDEALASYGAQLARRGYRRMPLAVEDRQAPQAREPARAPAPSQVFVQGNDVLILFATEQDDAPGSLVSATRIVRRGYVAAAEDER